MPDADVKHYRNSSWATQRDATGTIVVRTWCERWAPKMQTTEIRTSVTCPDCRKEM